MDEPKREKPQGYYEDRRWLFDARGETWEIRWKGDRLRVSETRCNGQEDSHVIELAVLRRGKWVWLDESNSNGFEEYRPDGSGAEVLAHINTYGPPPRNGEST